ncbi:RNA polymerase sigma factor [Blastococcus sp. SYSU DS0619]
MSGSWEAVDEAELVRRTAAGDRQAFDELYRRTSPWLAVRLQRRCSDEDVVADVLQETYLAVWRATGSFAGTATSGSAVGWIARRRRADRLRTGRAGPAPARRGGSLTRAHRTRRRGPRAADLPVRAAVISASRGEGRFLMSAPCRRMRADGAHRRTPTVERSR